MDIFLPTQTAGRVKIGDEASIVLDALPDEADAAPAVSFLAAHNEFTPKTVETKSERDKLMFRVRVRIDPGAASGARGAGPLRPARPRLHPPGPAHALARRVAARHRATDAARHKPVPVFPVAILAGHAVLRDVWHRYGKQAALRGVSIELHAWRAGGADRAGRRRQVHAARPSWPGQRRCRPARRRWCSLFGGDFIQARHRRARCAPASPTCRRGLASNLYPDLTVRENIAFFSRLFGQGAAERRTGAPPSCSNGDGPGTLCRARRRASCRAACGRSWACAAPLSTTRTC